MKRKIKQDQIALDPEERDLLTSFEKGEWIEVSHSAKEKAYAKKSAAKTLRKDVRINIRLSSNDLANIKQIAAYEGLPYQTLISSTLHKFASGHMNPV